MSSNLLIVESPAKSRTLKKYLGPDFEIMASYGHVRDLVPKEGAVDTDNGFAMKYEIIDRNRKHVSDILRRLKGADNLYLATDPDREGEAISWHLYEILKEKKALKDKNVYRLRRNWRKTPPPSPRNSSRPRAPDWSSLISPARNTRAGCAA